MKIGRNTDPNRTRNQLGTFQVGAVRYEWLKHGTQKKNFFIIIYIIYNIETSLILAQSVQLAQSAQVYF